MLGPHQHLFSSEHECMTVAWTGAGPERTRVDPDDAVSAFFAHFRRLAPTAGSAGGLFNSYGRVYLDCGHIEFAMIECDDPFVLAQVIETQHDLAAQAAAELNERGLQLRLAVNNHSGLLARGAPTWGAHENYLVATDPHRFDRQALPFLVSRFYAGSGGVCCPDATYVAGVRHMMMRAATGGSTTEQRAIHSTCRDEHLHDVGAPLFRYHLILGDGHRSQFNWALQFGATALALKAIQHDPRLHECLERVVKPSMSRSWLATLRRWNVLAKPGRPPRVSRRAIAVQRVYLDAVRRMVEQTDQPAWAPAIVEAWERTLDAAARNDRAWLAQRLDAFIKHQLFSVSLKQAGVSWSKAAGDQRLLAQLALLDQSYHEFAQPDSAFAALDRAGLLRHRVRPFTRAGSEPEPYVPPVRTRARPRARLLANHPCPHRLQVDWMRICDEHGMGVWSLGHPLASECRVVRPPQPRQRGGRRLDIAGLADDDAVF